MVPVCRSGRPVRRLGGEDRTQSLGIRDRGQVETLVDHRKAGFVGQQLPDRHALLAVLRELGPVRGDWLVELEQASRVSHGDCGGRHSLRRREHRHQRVGFPSTTELPVSPTAPEIDNELTIEVRGDRRPDLSPSAEVRLERVSYRTEALGDIAADPIILKRRQALRLPALERLCERRLSFQRAAPARKVCDDVGGVAVEGDAGAVVAHGRARVGVAGGFLDVAQRDAGVERGGDERVAQRVRSDSLGDAGASGDAPHDPAGGVPVEPVAVRAEEDRAFAAFADGEVDSSRGARCERDGDDLAALAAGWSGCGGRARGRVARCRRRVASETRSPLSASREMSAWSRAPARPAATSMAPTSLRSSPVAWDS